VSVQCAGSIMYLVKCVYVYFGPLSTRMYIPKWRDTGFVLRLRYNKAVCCFTFCYVIVCLGICYMHKALGFCLKLGC